MGRRLIIFIDALPYFLLSKRKDCYLNKLANVRPLTPGIGFSLNIYPVLFAGLRPDQLGVFNEWFPKRSPAKVGWLSQLVFNLLDLARVVPLLSRILHIIYSKIAKTKNLGNIPFKYLPYFEEKGSLDIFFKKEIKTIFNSYDLKLSLSPMCDRKNGRNDFLAYEKALQYVKEKHSIFVMFTGLDNIAHYHGLGSNEYENRFKELDKICEELVQEFLKVNGAGAEVIILSDHGMADVKHYDYVNVEKALGMAGPGKYLYFLDSTFLRIWIVKEEIRSKAKKYLDQLACGALLSDQDRARYGIKNRDYGDFVFMLDEGRIFFPDFMGGRHMKAMHGYSPEIESQKGIFIHYGQPSQPGSIDAMEAYRQIAGSLDRSAVVLHK